MIFRKDQLSHSIYKYLLPVLILISLNGNAQKIRFERFNVESGMQNNIVFQTTQDAKGLIWFATMTGIDRFDGNKFIHYAVPLKNGGYTSYSQIPYILSDAEKQIWAASANAIYLYNLKKDVFEIPEFVNGILEKNRAITSLSVGNQGKNLLVGINSGFYIYNHSERKIITPTNFNKYVRCVFQDNKGLVWVGTNKSLHRFVIDGGQANELISSMPALVQLKEMPISHISQDNFGRFWIVSTQGGLYVYDEKSDKIEKVLLPKAAVRSYTVKDIYFEKQTGNAYISMDGAGLIVIDKNLAIVGSYQTNEDDLTSLSNNAAYDIFSDRYNRLWITTYGGGVNAVIPATQPFVSFQHEINNNNSLSNNAAKAVTEDATGNIWFGTRKGISKYNPVSKMWMHFNEETKSPIFTSDNVLSLNTGTQNTIWVGTYGGGLIKINAYNNEINTYLSKSYDSNSIGTDYVYAVLNDSKGRVWAGGIRGQLSYLNINTGKFTRISTPIASINCIIEDSNAEILLGTEKGVFAIQQNKIVNLFPQIVTEKILTILEYSPNKYWLGTLGGGIIVVSKEKGIEQIFKSEAGLPSDVICALIKDKNGDVWSGTSKGIAQYQSKTKTFIAYTKADGLSGSQVNYGAAYFTKSGEIIFGTTDGFSAFSPQKIKSKGYKPFIVFTGLSVNNKQISVGEENKILQQQIDELGELQLEYNHNSFAIDFVNTSPALSGKHLYSWKLEGFDKEWTKASVIPSAVYTNLNSGKYSLLVKAFTKGQTEFSDTRRLNIQILYPWWRSGWAYLMYLFIVTAGIIAGRNYYKNLSTRKKYAERLRLNTSISHEIRTPLTLIKGPVSALSVSPDLSKENQSNLLLAKKNIEKLENIIGQFIDFQKTGVDKMQMQVRKGNIITVLDDVIASFIPLMKQKQIHFTYLKTSEEIELLFDKDKIEKVFNNLISNAVKYTPNSQDISVAVTKDSKYFIITISDTGIGIPKEQQKFIFKGYFRADNTVNLKETGSGIGLSVAKELIEMHHGKLSFTSEQNKATTFSVKIPLQNDSLLPYLINQKEFDEIIEIPVLSNLQSKNTINKQIVIAEDNDELLQYLKAELTKVGYNVFPAVNGLEAYNCVQKNNIDLVITDVMMPELNGFQLCEKLKNEISSCHIPIIMLTAIHDKDYLLEGYRCGADDYVKKPFDLAYIITRIENMLQNRTRFRNKILSVFDQESALTNGDADISWLKTATEIIVEKISDPQFSVEMLSSLMNMSRPVLFRRFKAITNESPQHYINQIRLRKAVELLNKKNLNINEVAFECGFGDAKYFSTSFKKHFGKSPSDYIKK